MFCYLFKLLFLGFLQLKGNFAGGQNNSHYYMARQIQAFWLVLSWSGSRHTDRFRVNGQELRIFCLRKPLKFKTNMTRVPHNKLLTNLASSSRTEEYWPSVVRVRTSLRSGQYSPVRPSRFVSKRLISWLSSFKHRPHNAGKFWKRSFILAVRPTVHTHPTRKRSFSKTSSNRRNLKSKL